MGPAALDTKWFQTQSPPEWGRRPDEDDKEYERPKDNPTGDKSFMFHRYPPSFFHYNINLDLQQPAGTELE
jgi:hypothetical protein